MPDAEPAPDPQPAPEPEPPPPPPPPPSGGQTVSLIAVGDTGMCSERDAVQRTADLASRFAGPLLLLGDLAYDRGTYQEFMSCFDPAWGRQRDRFLPLPGNHDHGTPGAAGYVQYFGERALPQGRTYYSLHIGDWLVLMLDSSERMHIGSAQYEFARHELTRNPARCTIGAWHHPLFSSGPNGNTPYVRDIAALLAEHNTEILLSGHDHLYERFARQLADGRSDPRGFRQFVVGTGGARSYQLARREPHSQAIFSTHGVLRLTLRPLAYQWEFVDVLGNLLDSGADSCH